MYVYTVLAGMVALTTQQFWLVNSLAGKLMLPYLGFNIFAVALNKAILDRYK